MQTLENGRVVFLRNESFPAFQPHDGGSIRRLNGRRASASELDAKRSGPVLVASDLMTEQSHCYLCGGPLSDAEVVRQVQQIFWASDLVKCGCGLVQKRWHATAQLLDRIYDKDYTNFTIPTLDSARHSVGSRVLRLGRPAGRLLDVGCGNGAFTLAASAAGWDAWGVDPYLPYSTQKAVPQTRRVDILDAVQRADLGCFDVVTLWAVWEHLVEPVAMLEAAVSLLKKGGRLVLNSPNGDSLHRRYLSSWHMTSLVEHLHFLTPLSVHTLARRLQLRVEKIRRCGAPFPLGGRGEGALGQGLNRSTLAFLCGTEPTAFPEKGSANDSSKSKVTSIPARLARHPIVGKIGRKAVDTVPVGDHLEAYLIRP